MTRLAAGAVDALLRSIPLQVYRRVIGRSDLGIGYHVVSDRPLPHVQHLYAYKSRWMFEQDLLYLKHREELVGYEALVNSRTGLPAAGRRRLALTVDDGYAECFSEMKPLLLRHAIPCIFFVTTDLLDNRTMFYRNKVSLCVHQIESVDELAWTELRGKLERISERELPTRASLIEWLLSLHPPHERAIDETCQALGIDVDGYLQEHRPYLTTEEIRGLVRDGFTIGAHSKSHALLSALSEDQIEEEIVDSCRRVVALTGAKRVPFAFPYSAEGIRPSFLERLTSKHDFIGLLFDKGLSRRGGSVIGRFSGDEAGDGEIDGSNLPDLMHREFRESAKQGLRALLRRRS